jgi:hypothetical protein
MAGYRRKPERREQQVKVRHRPSAHERRSAPAPRLKGFQGLLQALRHLDTMGRVGKVEQRPINIKQYRACSKVDPVNHNHKCPMSSSQSRQRLEAELGSLVWQPRVSRMGALDFGPKD